MEKNTKKRNAEMSSSSWNESMLPSNMKTYENKKIKKKKKKTYENIAHIYKGKYIVRFKIF